MGATADSPFVQIQHRVDVEGLLSDAVLGRRGDRDSVSVLERVRNVEARLLLKQATGNKRAGIGV